MAMESVYSDFNFPHFILVIGTKEDIEDKDELIRTG